MQCPCCGRAGSIDGVELWRPREAWQFQRNCNRAGCYGLQNGSGLCGQHYYKWRRRKQAWLWLKSLFVKSPVIENTEPVATEPGAWK